MPSIGSAYIWKRKKIKMKEKRTMGGPILACLFAALISVGAYIAIPIPGTPVPIVLQNFFIMLAGLLLGPALGTAATLIYLALGAIGLPVFAGGTGGIARFLGPTGGYLFGYIAAVFIMGLISRLGRKRRWWRDAAALAAGCAVVYAIGVSWLKTAIGSSWEKAIAGGLLPFLIGDTVKAALAVLLAGRLSALVERIVPWRNINLKKSDRSNNE